jgi:hypothetical protein
MSPEEFAALGVAMSKVRDAALGIHQAAVAEECAVAELEWTPEDAAGSRPAALAAAES